MRVYEAKIVYSLISLGEEIRLDRPQKVVDYLRSAVEENPVQEAFYCVYLDRKNHPLARHMITLGTATSTVAAPREVFRGAILAGATALVVAHNHPSGVMPHPVLCRKPRVSRVKRPVWIRHKNGPMAVANVRD